MKKQMMICLTFLCLVTTVFAQNATMTFLFPIEEIANGSNQFLATENFGFEVGTTGDVYGLYDKNNRARNQKIGTITIIKIEGISVYFDYENKTDVTIKKGDLIAFEIDVPKTNHERVLYKIFALNIRFLDVYDKFVFEGFDFGKIVSEAEEKALMNKLLDEIHFVGSAMKEQSETFPKITEKGRFGDTDIYSAMEMATYEDLRSFLRYVEAKSLKYQGHTWRISEVFATWADSGTPCTADDISELLLTDDEKSWQKYKRNLTKEAIEEAAESWRSEAEDLAKNGDFDKAFTLVEKSMNLGEKTENQSIIAWSYYTKGYLFGQEENIKKSIEYYEKSKAIFDKNGQKIETIVVRCNIGNALNLVGEYETALKYLEEAEKAQSKLVKGKTDNEVINNFRALILRNQGDSYTGLEQFKKALKSYEEALTYVKNATSDKGITRKIMIYNQMAEMYKAMGESELSEEYAQKATDTLMEMLWNN
ncbi:MAG: tetratricopeptide repeat protein [Saprospiraceae bacterium]